jgi:UDPglucose--hexose-1-phosphate uridylyltransferase
MSSLKQNNSDIFPQLRQDPISGTWIVVAPGRRGRPEEFDQSKIIKRKAVAQKEKCPFCEGNEVKFGNPKSYLEYPRKGGKWSVRVIPNKYPAFVKYQNLKPYLVDSQTRIQNLFIRHSSIGAHEVIITYDHENHIPKQQTWLVDEMLRAYRERLLDLKKDQKIKYVHIFVNEGDEAGASIGHPHSQLTALTFIPEMIQRELEGAGQYYKLFKKCIFCDIIKKDVEHRLIIENKNFVTIAPYFSRFPFEMWILPKNHQSSFEEMNDATRKDLAKILKYSLLKLDKGLGEPAYNYFIHTAPVNIVGYKPEIPNFYHWHIEIFPRIDIWAGVELGTGVIINTMVPEVAAEFLKKIE